MPSTSLINTETERLRALHDQGLLFWVWRGRAALGAESGAQRVGGAASPGRPLQNKRPWLHDYDLLDTLPEAAFDELVTLAARICGTPIAAVSLVARDRPWF